MSAANANNAKALYSELVSYGDSSEYDKALKIANKILHDDSQDKKAQHCKAVCLIHLTQFDEALKILEKHVPEAVFERAYCLYRLNRVEEAYDILKGIKDPSGREKELIAQVLYRLERYEDCFDYYRDLIKNSEDDYENERETNLSAVVCNLYAEKGKEFKNAPQLREHTYELSYNSACIHITQGDYSAAIEKLKAAEELCKSYLEDDATEEEIEAELAVIRVQHGYALQVLKKNDRALRMYNQVLKSKPDDVAVAAVASNNVVTINKDQNVFDSKKKIKVATAEGLEPKLTTKQRQTIATNNCLLLLHTNQLDQCRRAIQALSKKFPSCAAETALLMAALHCKEKKVQKAVDVLKDFAASHPDQSVVLSFTLAQLLLAQGHISQACDTLRSMGDVSYSLGVTSALVTLYLSLEDKEAAAGTLQSAIKWYRKNKSKGPGLNVLIQEAAKIELKNDNPQEASKLLEELRKEDPSDLKTLAQLIAAYSQFNPEKAKTVSKQLPPVSEITSGVDVDTLESTSWTMGTRYIKRGGKSEPTPGKFGKSPSGTGDELIQKKKKKHKKGKMPKNYDPNVDPDPERWLPRRERSTYKKKRDKRGATAIGKGTQGAAAGAEEFTTMAPSPSASATPTSPNVAGPRQNKGASKKKKKGRW